MVYETKGPHSKKLLIRAETGWLTDAQGEKIPVKYYVAENHDPIYQNQFRFDAMFAVAILLTLLALFFLQKFLIKRTFSTLHPITEKLKTLESHRTVDLDSKEAPLEVQPLLVALQNALTRLQKQLENFRKQNANLAHSLKTPINILYQQADLLPDNAQRQQIQQQLNTLTRLVERELKKARISEGIQQAQCFHLKKDLTPLITSIQTLHQEKNLKIEKHCQNSQSCLPIEQEDGYELLGNLLDNAAKWCQHKVEITCEAQQLIIEDDGPGVPPEQLANIRQRGQRLDETTPGHGIGLSIVEDISDAYEIKITFSRSKKLGGLSVQLLFS
jgi:signal transduction histidine kinase